MASVSPLHEYRNLTESPVSYATANVTALTPGDVRWFASVGFTSEWFEPRRLSSTQTPEPEVASEGGSRNSVYCAVCRVTFSGDVCERCGAGVGAGHAVADAPSDGGLPVGRLYLPSPEERRGWGSHYVYRPAEERPSRPLGFGRR